MDRRQPLAALPPGAAMLAMPWVARTQAAPVRFALDWSLQGFEVEPL